MYNMRFVYCILTICELFMLLNRNFSKSAAGHRRLGKGAEAWFQNQAGSLAPN